MVTPSISSYDVIQAFTLLKIHTGRILSHLIDYPVATTNKSLRYASLGILAKTRFGSRTRAAPVSVGSREVFRLFARFAGRGVESQGMIIPGTAWRCSAPMSMHHLRYIAVSAGEEGSRCPSDHRIIEAEFAGQVFLRRGEEFLSFSVLDLHPP